MTTLEKELTKAKKNIEIDKLNYTASGSTANSEYKISYDDTYAIYKDGKFINPEKLVGKKLTDI